MEMPFGEYLRQLRNSKGLSSTHLGVSQTFISNIETGNRPAPSPDIIRKLSSALGVTHIGMMIKAGHVTEEEVMQAARDEVDRLRDALRTLEDHVEGQGLLIIQDALKS
jgi:transcriptional regulator with XRE-family HTH domain